MGLAQPWLLIPSFSPRRRGSMPERWPQSPHSVVKSPAWVPASAGTARFERPVSGPVSLLLQTGQRGLGVLAGFAGHAVGVLGDADAFENGRIDPHAFPPAH